jgi:hypothetical protein
MTYAAVEKMLLGWPGVERSTSYGRPSLKVLGRFFTWVKEDGDSIVLGGIDFDERDMLMETQGDVFYITDHYRNSRAVLMRLSKADPAAIEAFLRRRWFAVAPKKLHAAFTGGQTPASAPGTTGRSTQKPAPKKRRAGRSRS